MKEKTWFKVAVRVAVIIAIIGTSFPLYRHKEPLQPVPAQKLNKSTLWNEICKYPFQDCVLVWKSAIQESGHDFDSKNVTARNNLFGMNCNKRVPECDGIYAVYEHWQYSVEDRFVHEVLYYKGGSYARYINRHWGIMDGTYVGTINKIKFKLCL